MKYLFFTLPFLLVACSYFYPVYIVNKTGEEVLLQLTIKPGYDINQLDLGSIHSVDLDAKWSDYEQRRLQFEHLNDSIVKVVFPVNSTTLLSKAINDTPDYFSAYSFKIGDKEKNYTDKEFFKKLRRSNFFKFFDHRNYFVLK